MTSVHPAEQIESDLLERENSTSDERVKFHISVLQTLHQHAEPKRARVFLATKYHNT